MINVFYVFVSAIFLALYDFFKKISVKKNKDIFEILLFFTFVAWVCSLVFVKQAIIIDFKYVFFIFVKSIIISISWFMTTKAMSKLDMGLVIPFSLMGVVFTTILAFLFFGEKIGFIQIGGMFIILVGLVLLSRLNVKEENKKNDYKYILLLILAAFLSSISALMDKKLLVNIKEGSVLFWFFFFLFFIYLIVCFVKNRRINFSEFTGNLWIIGIGFSIFFSDLFYYLAVSSNGVSLSVISIIKKLSVFIGVVLGCVFLKEENFFKKIFILILMFVGLSIIILL